MNHDMLELAKVPRQRAELTTVLNEARYQRKRARIKRLVTIVVVIIALALLFLRFTGILHAHELGLYLGGFV